MIGQLLFHLGHQPLFCILLCLVYLSLVFFFKFSNLSIGSLLFIFDPLIELLLSLLFSFLLLLGFAFHIGNKPLSLCFLFNSDFSVSLCLIFSFLSLSLGFPSVHQIILHLLILSLSTFKFLFFFSLDFLVIPTDFLLIFQGVTIG